MHRTPRVVRTVGYVPPPETLLLLCVKELACAGLDASGALQQLPPDCIQLLVDEYCGTQRLTHLVLEQLLANFNDGEDLSLFRVALRAAEGTASPLAWQIDDGWLGLCSRLVTLEVLELPHCYRITDEALAPALRRLPLLRVTA